jgi:hypothetical protein
MAWRCATFAGKWMGTFTLGAPAGGALLGPPGGSFTARGAPPVDDRIETDASGLVLRCGASAPWVWAAAGGLGDAGLGATATAGDDDGSVESDTTASPDTDILVWSPVALCSCVAGTGDLGRGGGALGSTGCDFFAPSKPDVEWSDLDGRFGGSFGTTRGGTGALPLMVRSHNKGLVIGPTCQRQTASPPHAEDEPQTNGSELVRCVGIQGTSRAMTHAA